MNYRIDMRFTILAIGKLKEKYFADAVREYEKRLSRYGKIEILEFPDEKTTEGASEAEERLVRDKEAEKVLKYLDDHAGYVIALAIAGERFDSVAFAERLAGLMNQGKSQIFFLIGGSTGLSETLLKRADLWLSFSDFTFPHQLMRVILLEQLYRAMRIIKKEPYHK